MCHCLDALLDFIGDLLIVGNILVWGLLGFIYLIALPLSKLGERVRNYHVNEKN